MHSQGGRVGANTFPLGFRGDGEPIQLREAVGRKAVAELELAIAAQCGDEGRGALVERCAGVHQNLDQGRILTPLSLGVGQRAETPRAVGRLGWRPVANRHFKMQTELGRDEGAVGLGALGAWAELAEVQRALGPGEAYGAVAHQDVHA